MALSQLQCLDDNNVNPRTHEAKPDFLYCENQRLALEVLLRDGREAFHGFLKARELRGFLSDLELETLPRAVEPYDPGSDVLHSASAVDDSDDAAPLSLHYWPDLSDTSVPELDLGWPDCASYRGVTRTNVYTQPPQDGQVHIKEIVRKTIAQAQKVIGIVMDLFTLPHFLSMCDRANMHPGHLKNLRVRCGGGGEFFTRSCTRLRGRLGHRFMFVDGDRAVSGSYCYTWMSSRLDRHLITVVTGQAVDAFDRLFRELYGTSSAVDLQRVAMEPEPEPEPLPQPVAVVPASAEVTRKLHNPMYALLSMGMNNTSPASSLGPNSPKKAEEVSMKDKRKMAKKAAPMEAPPIHPGLVDLEKAYLIPYLPTWPEPDPSSDVIGFINVRDSSRPTQVHMQRSERFETSQAIRFSSPFSAPKETLPEVAQPRQHAANPQEITVQKAYLTQVSAQEVAVDKAQPTSPYTGPSTLATQPPGRDVHIVENKSVDTHILISEPKVKAEKQPFNTESKPSTNTATQQITTPHIDAPTSFSNKAPIIKPGSAVPTRPIHNLTIKDPGRYPDIASKSHVGPTIHTDKNIHGEHVSNSDHMQTSNPASSHVHASPSAINQHDAALPVQTQNRIAHKISCKEDLGTKPQSPYKEDFTCIPISTLSGTISASTVSPARPAPFSSIPTFSRPSSSNPSINSHSANTSPLPCSTQSTSTLTPPVPKPRTVHLLMDSWSKCNVLSQPLETGVVSEPGKQSGSGPVVDYCKPVFKQQEDAIMTGTRTQIGPNTVLNSTSKLAEWQDRSDMKTYLLNPVKDGLSKEFPDSKKATNQRTQSILTANTLQADKDSESVTKQHFKKATHVQTNEGLLQQHGQSRTATASEPPSSFHAPEINTVVDTQHTPKQNADATPGSLSVNALDSISRAHTQGGQRGVTTHPSNDEAVNHVRNRLNSAKAKRDSHMAEEPTRPHTLELPTCVPTPEREWQSREAPACAPTAGRISPCTPAAVWRTPDAHCCPSPSPDTRTPTPDMSDGYISSRDSSTLSTTSDEYYECDESPSPVLDLGIGQDNRMPDDLFFATPGRDYTRAMSANADTNVIPSPTHMNAANTKGGFETSISPSFVPQIRAQTKYKGESEEESRREEYKVWGGEGRAAILAADEQSRTGSEGRSQTAKEGRHRFPMKITKYEESTVCLTPQTRSDPPETVDIDMYPSSASRKKSVDSGQSVETSTPPILRRSSSSASSENTISPFITPVPSPAPTPTPKRAAAHPRRPQPDTEVGRSAGVSSMGGQGQGKQVFRKDSLQESGEFTRKWEEDLQRDGQKDTELDLGTSSLRSYETSAPRTSGAEMKRGPWVARETEGKGLRSPPRAPQGRPQQQNHHSPVSLQSPTAKPVRPTRLYSTQPPRSYQPAVQVSSKVDHDSPQTLHNNSAPRQLPFRRHSSMTAAESPKGADQNSRSEDSTRRSFHYGQPLAGQGSGPFPKPQPSFLYSYHTNSPSQLQPQTQPMDPGNQVAQTQSKYRQGSAVGDLVPGDTGQDLSKTGFSFPFSKLSIKGLKNKGSSSPLQSKRSLDPSEQVRKSTG